MRLIKNIRMSEGPCWIRPKVHLVQQSVHTVANLLSTRDLQAGHGATAPSRPGSPTTGAHGLTALDTGGSTKPSGPVTIDSLLLQEFIHPTFKAIQIGGHHHIFGNGFQLGAV